MSCPRCHDNDTLATRTHTHAQPVLALLQVASCRLQAASCLWGRKSQLRRDLNAGRVNVKPRLGFARLERSRSSGQIWPNARYGYVLPIVPHLT